MMTSDEIAAIIRARINLVPWDNGIGCTLDGITYYAHGRSDDQDQALITTLSRLKSDVPALLDALDAAQAENIRLREQLVIQDGELAEDGRAFVALQARVKRLTAALESADAMALAMDRALSDDEDPEDRDSVLEMANALCEYRESRAALDGTAEAGGD